MSELVVMRELMRGVIPYLAIDGADKAIAFYQSAFGANVRGDVVRDEQGRVLNVSLQINGGCLMMSDHFPEFGEPPAKGRQGITLQLVSDEGRALWKRAVAAGCEVAQPFEMQFWGDEYGTLCDPFGLTWAINQPSAATQERAVAIDEAGR